MGTTFIAAILRTGHNGTVKRGEAYRFSRHPSMQSKVAPICCVYTQTLAGGFALPVYRRMPCSALPLAGIYITLGEQ
jgi:hypothetical protein